MPKIEIIVVYDRNKIFAYDKQKYYLYVLYDPNLMLTLNFPMFSNPPIYKIIVKSLRTFRGRFISIDS